MDCDRFSPSDAVPSAFNPLIFDAEAVTQSSVRLHFIKASMNIYDRVALCV